MKKRQIVNKPITSKSIAFDDLYEEFSRNWELKAKQMQDRRWRQLKRSIKENPNHGQF